MQQTDKYKFNIIETSDTFGPEKLNENAQKLEDALNTHEGTVSAALAQHKSETTTALTQHKSEVTTALGTKADKTALDTLSKTVTANKTAVDTTITAVEKGAKLFHLAGPVVGSGSNFTVSLSGVNMSQYRALLAFVRQNSNTTISAGSMSISIGAGVCVVWLYTEGSQGRDHLIAFNCGGSTSAYAYGSSAVTSQWTSIKSISCGSTTNFIDVYGIKA